MRNAFYLQDTRTTVGSSAQWWGANGNGYPTDLGRAQRYSLAEAQAQHNTRPTDLPWPADFVDAHTHRAVDMQCLDRSTNFDEETEFYLQQVGSFNGNDLYWLTSLGGSSSHLSDAGVFSKEAAWSRLQSSQSLKVWGKRYIDGKSRLVVDVSSLKDRTLCAESGIVLQKARRESAGKHSCRCSGCQRFMSVVDYYAGSCRHCGTDSRP